MHTGEPATRTTLTFADDVLSAAKSIAAQTSKSVGEVISDLARSALRPLSPQRQQNGVPLLPVGNPDAMVTT
jgi:hypothetical protein